VIRGKTNKPVASPLKLLLWVAFAGLIFGVLGVGQPVEDLLRSGRNKLHTHAASGEIVVIAIDERALEALGRWPWRRSVEAKLTKTLHAAGAKRIFFDILFDTASEPAEDKAFEEAIEQSGKVVLPVRTRSGRMGETISASNPLPQFAKNVSLGSISFQYDYRNAAWELPFSDLAGDKAIPSFSALLAGRAGQSGEKFRVDYSLDPATIPSISAVDVIKRSGSLAQVRGKDVIVGTTTDSLNDVYFIPGWGRIGGVYMHVIGAETLKSGAPLDLGWAGAFTATLILAACALRCRSIIGKVAILATSFISLLVIPIPLEVRLIFIDITPALFVILVVTGVILRRHFRSQGLINSSTGLPNLVALRSNRAGKKQALIVARVLNYAEIAASMPESREGQLVEQIVSRLTLGSSDRILYQGDGGTFAWFEDPHLPFGNHLDAVYGLFRKPARVAGQQLDLAVSFGVEVGSSRSLPNRLASAIVAAEKAAQEGLRWRYHDPDMLEDASWKLSMMSQLDAAIDAGEVWVAYQPQLELATGQIVGCEALARWTHPQKGPISAIEFVSAAEQHDRIGKLTDFVLDTALAAAAKLDRTRPGFTMSVNLSAKLLTDRGLQLRIAAALARHGFPASQLIIELTETAELGIDATTIGTLSSIRDLGVTISIDDYGTGLSTLQYLKRIPAAEIKIDQSFVMGLAESRSDRLMVESTIALAHSLGRRVVAEGVQQRDVLEVLSKMGCDIAQGFIIGRPMSLDTLLKRVSGKRTIKVA
jgi:EAL domain-containing protein (putative c-di-GMP-specific phosphodiesterase class I)/CHASE2 domain-containing sensor protein